MGLNYLWNHVPIGAVRSPNGGAHVAIHHASLPIAVDDDKQSTSRKLMRKLNRETHTVNALS